MKLPVGKPRVAVLGLSLELYNQALPGYMDRLARQLTRFVARIKPLAAVTSSKLCYRQEAVRESIRAAEHDGVDALLVIPLSYTASGMSLTPLLRTALPVVIWNTQELQSVDESFTFDDMLMNHVAQGTQDLTSVLCRAGRVFGLASGHFADAAALAQVGEWLVAARTQRWARRCRVGMLGGPFQDMGDFGIDETMMSARWGPQVIQLQVPELVRLFQQADKAAVTRLVAADRRKYEVTGGVTPEIHRLSAQLEWALRRLIEVHELDAFTMNFRDLTADGRCPTLPFLGLNKLLGEGLGYAGEGDRITAAHMAQMTALCGAANFTEIFTMDYARDRILMMHMQECNPALARADRRVQLVRKNFWAPGTQPYVGMVFTLEPGPVTLTALIPDGSGRFTYVAYETQIVDRAPLPHLDVPHWLIQLDEPVGDFLTRYSLAGGPHHLVSIPGRQIARLQKLAALQGFGFTQV